MTKFAREVVSFPLWQSAILIVAGAMAAVVTLWTIDTTPPVTTLSATAVTPIVAPGEILRVRYDVERSRSCAVKIDRVLLDGDRVRFNLDDLEYAAAPGPLGHDQYTVPIQIPRTFGQGSATYQTVTRYECNLLHKLWPLLTRTVVPFTVRGPPIAEEVPLEFQPPR